MNWVRLHAVWFWMPICLVYMVIAKHSEHATLIYVGLAALLIVCIFISRIEFRKVRYLRYLVARQTDLATDEVIRLFINHTMPHRHVNCIDYFERIRNQHGVVRIGHLLLALKSPLVYPDSTPSFSPASPTI